MLSAMPSMAPGDSPCGIRWTVSQINWRTSVGICQNIGAFLEERCIGKPTHLAPWVKEEIVFVFLSVDMVSSVVQSLCHVRSCEVMDCSLLAPVSTFLRQEYYDWFSFLLPLHHLPWESDSHLLHSRTTWGNPVK